jgi:hypothetical protein
MSKDLGNVEEKNIIIVVHDTSFCKESCKEYESCQNIIRSEDKLAAECVWNDKELLSTQLTTK